MRQQAVMCLWWARLGWDVVLDYVVGVDIPCPYRAFLSARRFTRELPRNYAKY